METGNTQPDRNLNRLLDQVNDGRAAAFTDLVGSLYNEFRRLASQQMSRQFDQPIGSLTLSPTAIADNAIMELRGQRKQWRDVDHFCGIATFLIRRQVLMYKRSRRARLQPKRIDDAGQLAAEETEMLTEFPALTAVSELQVSHPRAAEVVSLHVIFELSLPNVAKLLKTSLRTVEREWQLGREWLLNKLRADDPHARPSEK